MSMNTKDIKRRIAGGRTAPQLEREPAQLALAEIGGILWASNRYWVTPAARVTALLAEYNLPVEPGLSLVNGTVRPHPAGVNVEAMTEKTADLMDQSKYPLAATPVLLGGRAAHVPAGTKPASWLAVYQTTAGDHLGLPADDVAWLTATGYSGYGTAMAELIGLDTRGDKSEHLGAVRVMAQQSDKEHQPVLFVADVIRTVTPSCYGPGDNGPHTHHPAVTENLGSRVIGALMARKLGS
jgi:hypothetical protein